MRDFYQKILNFRDEDDRRQTFSASIIDRPPPASQTVRVVIPNNLQLLQVYFRDLWTMKLLDSFKLLLRS